MILLLQQCSLSSKVTVGVHLTFYNAEELASKLGIFSVLLNDILLTFNKNNVF